MIKLTINNEIKEVEKGTTLLSLLDEQEQKKYFTCLVNGRVRELNFKISFDATLQFLDLSYIESMKAYEASMRFIVAKAFYELYPEEHIIFSYNVSRSIFVKSIDEHFIIDYSVVKKINEYIKKLIDEDLPIERLTFTKDEALKIFNDFHFEDKIELLKYKPEATVHLYKCGGYFNYMHSYMVPSTGFLKKYIIKQYAPGLIIQYPRAEKNGEIPAFEETRVYGKTLKMASKWVKMINAEKVCKINSHTTKDQANEFIQICETKHNNMLAELGEMIQNDIENIRLIAIAGPSSSGKTTFSNRLKIELMSRGITPVAISMDNYYLDRDKIKPGPDGKLDLEDINTLDIDLFNEQMLAIISGERVQMPKFDFTIAKRVPGEFIQVPKNSPIIIEGIHALNELMSESIPAHQKFKIFISPQMQVNIDDHSPLSTTDLRLIRRIVRDKQFRNATAEHTLGMWESVRSGEFKWIYPHQESSNYVYNSELTYELCVLKKYALPLLQDIKTDSPFFVTANRLIKYLKYFQEIDESAIPCNSLIREFIGGSCFNVNE